MKNAQLYYWAIVIAFSLGWFIHRQYQTPTTLTDSSPQPFQIPKISQHRWRQPLQAFDTPALSQNNNLHRYMGKYTFSDSIFISDDRLTWSKEDFLWPEQVNVEEHHASGLQIKVDTSLLITGRMNDKERAYLPAFIYNETLSDKFLIGMRWEPWSILEARAPDGQWYPIQYYRPQDCATDMGYLKIAPQEFCVLSLPLFTGNFRTELRLRIETGKQVLLSNTFKGRINRTQFELSPINPIRRLLKDIPEQWRQKYFLGSSPMALNWN